MKRAVWLLAMAGAALPAQALDVALNAGAIEVVGLKPSPVKHVAVYPSVGVSLVKPLEHLTLIPGLAVEAAPELGAWGLVASLVADFAVSDRLGLDLDVTVLHDQVGGDVRGAAFLAGGGVGCSLFFGKLTVSPFVNLFVGLNVEGLSLVPGVNVAWAL